MRSLLHGGLSRPPLGAAGRWQAALFVLLAGLLLIAGMGLSGALPLASLVEPVETAVPTAAVAEPEAPLASPAATAAAAAAALLARHTLGEWLARELAGETLAAALSAAPSATPTIAPTLPAPTATATGLPSETASPSPSATANPTSLPTASAPASAPGTASATVRPPSAVPILMYHYIRYNPDPADRLGYNLSVTPENFTRQMDHLAARGYQTIALQDILAYRQGIPLPAKPVVITFDDGYADAYTAAYPVLAKRGLRATFFIVSSFVGRGGYLNWGQIEELAAAGMEIGSHTVRHPDLSLLARPGLHAELQDSRRQLEEKLGRAINTLAYPSGRYNPTVLAAAAEAGYEVAVTTEPGSARLDGNLLRLPRVRVYGGITLAQFAALLP